VPETGAARSFGHRGDTRGRGRAVAWVRRYGGVRAKPMLRMMGPVGEGARGAAEAGGHFGVGRCGKLVAWRFGVAAARCGAAITLWRGAGLEA